MNPICLPSARILPLLVCISFIPLLAACGTPPGGYYDANGNYTATDTPHNMSEHAHSPLPGGNPHYRSDRANNIDYNDNYSEHPYYTRRGYYDYNGYYIARDSGLSVPQEMFPPRGMCRVWFTERPVSDQPDVESCNGIKSRVPAGAYVIYGG